MADLFTSSVDGVALVAATAKSVLELKTISTERIRIKSWWVWFDGVTASNVPVKMEVGRFSAVVTTGTAGTASKIDPGFQTATTVVTNATTVEGAGTAVDVELHRISPTSGVLIQYPLGNEWVVGVSGFWRIRLTAAAAVNATCGVTWEE